MATSTQQCPRCGASISTRAAKSLWGTIVGMQSQDVQPLRVPAPCCGQPLTAKQVKAVRWGNEKKASAWGRDLSAQRKTFAAGPGRPRKLRPCPKGCGESFSARDMRVHKPDCTGPARKKPK